MAHIRVVAHDPGWKEAFAAEAERLRQALGDNVLCVHHIGSTAIPGMPAKPIIDILLEVRDILQLENESGAMQGLGYEVLGEFGIPGRRYFRKSNPEGVRTHHVHAFQRGSPEIRRHLAFRDYMSAHPQAAEEYGKLKQELGRLHPDDAEAYMDGKDAFVKEHEAKALQWRNSGS